MTSRIGWVGLAGLLVAGALPVWPQACRDSLSACPKRGCTDPYTPAAYLNIQKRRTTPTSSSVVRLTFDDFRVLQDRAEEIFDGHYHTLSKTQRVRLRKLAMNGQDVGEGSLVEITGFITVLPAKSEPHANTSGETVNCRLTGPNNNDFHVSIVPDTNTKEWQGVVVEMVPQRRPDTWTESRLKDQVQQKRRMVRVRGLLFFDNHHRVNDDEAHNISNQPKRMSLWEIHPVTEFDVCMQATCTATGPGWVSLKELP